MKYSHYNETINKYEIIIYKKEHNYEVAFEQAAMWIGTVISKIIIFKIWHNKFLH